MPNQGISRLVLHPLTERMVREFISRPAHAVLVIGPSGSGKGHLSRHIAAELLGQPIEQLDQYPYISYVRSEDGKAISIEAIRGLQQAMTLKIPHASAASTTRIAIIEDAHTMTAEAQNALLKTLEEPPSGTVIIIASHSAEALLPTIISRTRSLHLTPPAHTQLRDYFASQGYVEADISRAIMLSGGLPGLMHALLAGEKDHPLYEATEHARTLLQSSAFDRLAMIDALSKQKALVLDVLFVLGQMAHAALEKSGSMPETSQKRWQTILRQSYASQEQLRHNVQAKLVLTDLMLNLS